MGFFVSVIDTPYNKIFNLVIIALQRLFYNRYARFRAGKKGLIIIDFLQSEISVRF